MTPESSWSGGIEAWLATPEAADEFDASRLAADKCAEWASLRTERRRRDWASSRALRAAVGIASDQESSLSHSHGHAALALSPSGIAVGVDVEWLLPRDFRGMASIAYAKAEADHLDTLHDPEDLCGTFYELWTLKEAFAKALRLPLVDALRQCRFVDAACGRDAVIPTTAYWRATVFAPRPRLRLTIVCVASTHEVLDLPLSTMEWPCPRTRDWTVIRSLSSGDRTRERGDNLHGAVP